MVPAGSMLQKCYCGVVTLLWGYNLYRYIIRFNLLRINKNFKKIKKIFSLHQQRWRAKTGPQCYWIYVWTQVGAGVKQRVFEHPTCFLLLGPISIHPNTIPRYLYQQWEHLNLTWCWYSKGAVKRQYSSNKRQRNTKINYFDCFEYYYCMLWLLGAW